MSIFLHKVAGTTVMALALFVLAALGFTPGDEQSPASLTGIRVLTPLAPALFLALATWIARGDPLTRTTHAKILEQLEARDGER